MRTPGPPDMEAYFNDPARVVDGALGKDERYTASFCGETTDFVRMNRGKVRQPGHVTQQQITLQLVRGARHASHSLTLTGDAATDTAALRDALSSLRAVLP